MTQPTHFIEVWKDSMGNIVNDSPQPIHEIGIAEILTEFICGTTIAVWKIYPKK